jgi:alpha-galactosidase
MNIRYIESYNIIRLDTDNTSYIMSVLPEDGYVGHVYYGRTIGDDDVRYLLRTDEVPAPSVKKREKCSFLDSFPMEMPGNGTGDYRDGCIEILDGGGHNAVELRYASHRIYNGKPALEGLPATFADENGCMTLELHLKDEAAELEVVVLMSVFEGSDAIARSVRVINHAAEPVRLNKIYSACLDIDDRDFQLLTLHGSWARERRMDIRDIGYGRQGVGSVRGESSHQEHPFEALVSRGVSQEQGEVYAFSFVYSGNFIAQVEKSQFDSLRMVMGINPENFSFLLESEGEFQAPEAVMTYSWEGLGRMTRCWHNLFREHLIRSRYKDIERPVLINNWEATYFDFDTDKLIAIAKAASKAGIEMLVMDDGWFGTRNNDDSSLGDWKVNEKKLPGGLGRLVSEVNALGMKFGIWFEPEMISPDSELYRAHPDWAIRIPGRDPSQSRCQYVLDLSNPAVCDCVYDQVAAVLHSANIEYVKWDMNRQLSDIGSAFLGRENQGELCHRYVLAVYRMQERLINEFPGLLLENCSGGGARFDAGMLYYSPQIWCSDDTDAVERLTIQEGTALLYPLSSIGAHVSVCPNHTVGRTTPFATRGDVALTGTFGYELDITKLPKEEFDAIPGQIERYHRFHGLISSGDYYRIASYSQNHMYDCYEVVSKDKKEALVTYVQVVGRPNAHSRFIRIPGLDKDTEYKIEGISGTYHGSTLGDAGIKVAALTGDSVSVLYHITSAEI